jgi:hypothetical protein
MKNFKNTLSLIIFTLLTTQSFGQIDIDLVTVAGSPGFQRVEVRYTAVGTDYTLALANWGNQTITIAFDGSVPITSTNVISSEISNVQNPSNFNFVDIFGQNYTFWDETAFGGAVFSGPDNYLILTPIVST